MLSIISQRVTSGSRFNQSPRAHSSYSYVLESRHRLATYIPCPWERASAVSACLAGGRPRAWLSPWWACWWWTLGPRSETPATGETAGGRGSVVMWGSCDGSRMCIVTWWVICHCRNVVATLQDVMCIHVEQTRLIEQCSLAPRPPPRFCRLQPGNEAVNSALQQIDNQLLNC